MSTGDGEVVEKVHFKEELTADVGDNAGYQQEAEIGVGKEERRDGTEGDTSATGIAAGPNGTASTAEDAMKNTSLSEPVAPGGESDPCVRPGLRGVDWGRVWEEERQRLAKHSWDHPWFSGPTRACWPAFDLKLPDRPTHVPSHGV
jgi:hypothetical protein